MNTEWLRLQLLAIRAQVDALLAAIEIAPAAPVRPAMLDCDHPEAARQDASTLRAPGQFLCTQCGRLVSAAVPVTDRSDDART